MPVVDLSILVPGHGSKRAGGNQQGSLFTLDDVDAAISRGLGFQVTVGAFSTGIVGGGAGTILDLDQPELAIGIPSGVAIRPVYFNVQVQVGLIAADNDENEILIAVDRLGVWSGDGTSTAETATGLRSDMGGGSRCRVGSAFTADMTTTPTGAAAADPVLDMELARFVQTVDILLASTPVDSHLKVTSLLYEPKHPPIIVGPATLLVYYGGTVATLGGFIQGHWVEALASEYINLT